MTPRIKNLVRAFSEHDLDAFLVTSDVNISYLTQYPSAESWLLVFPRKAVYVTDARYSREVRQRLRGVSVSQSPDSILRQVVRLIRCARARRIGFDERLVSLEMFKRMKRECPSGVEWCPCNHLVERLRVIKTGDEISAIRRAIKIHREALGYLHRIIRPGLTEADIRARIETYLRRREVSFAFAPIIASGPNSCFPHARVSRREFRRNETILLDVGVDLLGYKSDLTRMFFLGKIPPLVREVYEIVDVAQKKAIAQIRPGITAAEIDQQARNHIKKHKLSKYFCHALGHGVGLEVHEAPKISGKSSEVLKEGMVFTVEPAVYLPRRFGIRIEDMVLVTQKGCQVLSR